MSDAILSKPRSSIIDFIEVWADGQLFDTFTAPRTRVGIAAWLTQHGVNPEMVFDAMDDNTQYVVIDLDIYHAHLAKEKVKEEARREALDALSLLRDLAFESDRLGGFERTSKISRASRVLHALINQKEDQ